LGGLVIQLTSPDAATPPPKSTAGIALAPSEAGYLEVLADPWAEVRVDGVHLETTPFARPLPLAPGVHYVELTHPIFDTVRREIVIEAQKTIKLNEKLAEEKQAIAPASGAKK
jgi:hypothetical protein